MPPKPGKQYIAQLLSRYKDASKAATPYKRILRSKAVPKEVKDRLREQYKTLNLVKLKRQIDEILKRLKPTPVG